MSNVLTITDGINILTLRSSEILNLEIQLNKTSYAFKWKHIGDYLHNYYINIGKIGQNNSVLMVDTFQFNFLKNLAQTSHTSSCRLSIGDRVYVSNILLRLVDPIRDEFISYRAGYISKIIQGKYGQVFNKCVYEITFDDGSKAGEILEDDINLISGSLDKLANLALLNQNLVPQVRDYSETEESEVDLKLQDEITSYFYKKTIKWLKESHEFKKLQKHIKFIESKKGRPYIYKVIKLFIKKNKAKWYNLRTELYDDLKEYIRKKLASI
jgi:hypothetical protein